MPCFNPLVVFIRVLTPWMSIFWNSMPLRKPTRSPQPPSFPAPSFQNEHILWSSAFGPHLPLTWSVAHIRGSDLPNRRCRLNRVELVFTDLRLDSMSHSREFLKKVWAHLFSQWPHFFNRPGSLEKVVCSLWNSPHSQSLILVWGKMGFL